MKNEEGGVVIKSLTVSKLQRVETETNEDVRIAHKAILEGCFGKVTIVTPEEQNFAPGEDVELVVLRPQTKLSDYTKRGDLDEEDEETLEPV